MWFQHEQLKMKKLEKKNIVEFLKVNFSILFTRANYK